MVTTVIVVLVRTTRLRLLHHISDVFGNGGNDTITVFANNGSVLGQDGNDTITLTTTGADAQVTVDGGIGNDTITITSDSDAQVTIIGGAGNDTINYYQ